MALGDRGLGLAGSPNARELGGLPAGDGQRVRSGVLVRSGALGHLTDPDLARLARFGLACVIDLRGDPEVAHAPPDRLPAPLPALRRAPVFDRAHPVFTQLTTLLDDGDEVPELTPAGTAAAMDAIYRWFVHGGSARAAFATAVRSLADPANLPALFHCSAGKDRTGWLTVILLTALGVDRAVIDADYRRTNTDTAALQRQLLSQLPAAGPGEDAVAPLLAARPEYLAAGYAEATARYGSFDGYLRDGLGLDDALRSALRAQLLTEGR